MRWAIARGYREDNPADERVVAALGRNTRPPTHQDALRHPDVQNAINTVRNQRRLLGRPSSVAVPILTAARSGGVRNATWEELNPGRRVWLIPAERTRTGRPHRVPLSDAAVSIFDDASSHTAGRGLIFPSLRGKIQSSDGLAKLLKEHDIDCVLHGFRTSFRNWCAETVTPRAVAERALGHTIRNRAEAAYSRTDLLGRRRQLMGDWADYIT